MKEYVGLHGAARSWVIASQFTEHRKLLVLTKDQKEFEEVSRDLKTLVGEEQVLEFPPWELLPFEPISPSLDISAERLQTLSKVQTNDSFIVVTPITELLKKLIPKQILSSLSTQIYKTQNIEIEQIIKLLNDRGFEETSIVQDLGQYGARGNVIDFFPASTNRPIRVEISKGSITEIRIFDPETQRSVLDLDYVEIGLIREFIPASEVAPIISYIKSRGKELEVPPREIAHMMSQIKSKTWFSGCEWISPLITTSNETLLSFIPKETKFVLNDALGCEESIFDLEAVIQEREKRFSKDHEFFIPSELIYENAKKIFTDVKSKTEFKLSPIELISNEINDDLKKSPVQILSHAALSVKLTSKIGTGAGLSPLKSAVKDWRSNSQTRIAFLVGSEPRAERLQRMLLTIDIDAPIENTPLLTWWSDGRSPVSIIIGSLRQGFELKKERLVVISEQELFGERSQRKGKTKRVSLKKFLSSLGNLKEEDYVVHSDHGIAQYKGLTHIERDGYSGDFLILQYADSKLYLPVHNVARIQKFTAAEAQVPALDKLSQPHKWAKTKQKVRAAVASLAGDLIRLYAARSIAKGWRYDHIGALDDQFAEEFQYNETPDQLKAIEDTLIDLSKDSVMDRLVCGDVGFGKTEVAIRATYKVLQHARQVAVLVPTTILVEQHKRSFEKRFEGYPVKIGAVSRFYSSKANKEALSKLASGEIDVIIGTHRLLSKDVHFKDLGLVVIDEEHRFGVKQKERLKSYRKSVDVLTLTATPIPRTLHLSLLGIRDISVIATAPADRRVIRTYLAENEEHIIQDAIRRELGRNGQVFFIHNRIPSLPTVADFLQGLVPEARIAFAHGQMREGELDAIMKRFLDGEIDVLISTTIVESGLDIPNANTILISDAPHFGLAQLYQLRGRVGRSDRQAYAYFLIPRKRKLSFDAERRLQALQSLDDLGLGFQLAVRDLEIRGAGNLLGKEQSGNVLAVGFELYTQILREAVANLKGEEIELEELIEPEVKFLGESYIPEFYIPDISERLVLYQRLASSMRDEEFLDLESEIEDRFGNIPAPMKNYLDLMRCRSLFKMFGVIRAEQNVNKISLTLSPKSPISGKKLESLQKNLKESLSFSKNLVLSLKHPEGRVFLPGEAHAVFEDIFEKIRAS